MSQKIVNVDAAKVLELRQAGYTWNQIDEMLLPPSELKRNKEGKIVSQVFKFAKAKNLHECFTKIVSGAYTPTQIVTVIRKFSPFKKEVPVDLNDLNYVAGH